jgi:type VI secretion system protein ImpJ
MSIHNKVVWSEGLFLQPQHFQQQERYFERYVEARCRGLASNGWGFTEVELERDLLGIGKFGVRRLAGVFPDGTPFRLPDDDPLPLPIDIDANLRDQVIHLAIPLRRSGEPDLDREGASEVVRHELAELPARDVSSTSPDTAVLEVATLRTRLLPASLLSDAYASIPLAHVVECRSDRQVVLEDRFIPTALHSRASARLSTMCTELVGLLHQRGEALASRVAATGRGAAAEFADFLMLQAINRHEPLFAHFAESGMVHPETLYQACACAAGELATFTTTAKRPPAWPAYQHDRLRESFDPVIASLRASLSVVLEQNAVPIPLESRKFGISVAIVSDRTLYSSAVFILAARADLPAEELRRRFPAQLKIGPVERIRELVTLQLPGVPVSPLPVAPRQIPFHAGFAYFELDQNTDLWDQLKSSGGLAMHVAGEFPGLSMEFWAVRA